MRWPLNTFTVTQTFSNPPGHGGIDLAAPQGTAIYSPVTGVVIGDGENANYVGGKYVIVREATGERREFYMGHMTSNIVSNGQGVSEGQVIGYVGATGRATGPHVHFQIRRNGAGALIDPAPLFNNNTGDSQVIIQNADNWFGRCNKTMYQIRGRQLGREEFVKYAVGNEFLRWVEAVSDNAEADAATNAQEIGSIAIRDSWYGQIVNLQNMINDLNKRPSTEQIDSLNKQIADLVKSSEEATKKAAEAEAKLLEQSRRVGEIEAERAADQAAGNAFLRWIGNLLRKEK